MSTITQKREPSKYDVPRPKSKFILVIGGSGSGKSSLVDYIKNHEDSAGKVGAFSHDAFYKNGPLACYDSSDAFDWARFEHVIHCICEGKPFEIPIYSYEKHCVVGSVQAEYHPIWIIDGILAAHNANIAAKAEMIVFIKASLDICLMRRIKRDMRPESEGGRGRTLDSILEQWQQVRAAYMSYVKFKPEFKKKYAAKIKYIHNAAGIQDMYNSPVIPEIFQVIQAT